MRSSRISLRKQKTKVTAMERLDQRLCLSTSIVSGQTINGAIATVGQSDSYTFTITSGQVFVLSVGATTAASTYQPSLTIYNANNGKVYSSSSPTSDYSLRAFSSEFSFATGTYTAVVQGAYFNNTTATGAYSIELAVSNSTSIPDASGDGGTIVSGQTRTGTINRPGDVDAFTFAASANQTFQFSISDPDASSTYYPEVVIYDTHDNQVASAQFTASNEGAVATYSVPSNRAGTYTAFVLGDTPSNTGEYDAELAEAPATQAADSDGDGGPIVSGQTIQGTINRVADLDVYTFSASAGQTLEMSLSDGDAPSKYRPILYIYNPSGVAVGDTAASGPNSSVRETYQVPSTGAGTYTAIVGSAPGSGLGSYALELASAPATQAIDSNGDGGNITSGQTLSGTINRSGDLDVFTFSGNAGDDFAFTAAPAANSAYLPDIDIYDPNGNQVYSGATTSANASVSGTYTVPSTGAGTYTAIVQGNGATNTGAYNITFGPAPSTPQPKVGTSQIAGGAVQRSTVQTFSITFDQAVSLAAGAYTLDQEVVYGSGGAVDTLAAPADVTSSVSAAMSGNTVTFTIIPGSALDRTAASAKPVGILTNGIYQLVLHGNKISAAADSSVFFDGGADEPVSFSSAQAKSGTSPYFHALFGDYNGDGAVNLTDYRQFTKAYLSSSGQSTYDSSFDYGGDGIINLLDYRQFVNDYLLQYTY